MGDFLALQNVIVEAEVRDRQLKHLIIPCCVLLKNGTCGHVQIVIWVLVKRTKKLRQLLICIQRATDLLGSSCSQAYYFTNIYIYPFGRCFYPKPLKSAVRYLLLFLSVCMFSRIEHMTLTFLALCSTS